MQCFGFASSFPCQSPVGLKDWPALRHPVGDGSAPPEGTPASVSRSTGTLSSPHTTPDHQPAPTSTPPREEPGDTHHSWRKKEPQELAPTCQTKHTSNRGGRQPTLASPVAKAKQAGGLYLLHLPRGRVSGPAEDLWVGVLAHQELQSAALHQQQLVAGQLGVSSRPQAPGPSCSPSSGGAEEGLWPEHSNGAGFVERPVPPGGLSPAPGPWCSGHLGVGQCSNAAHRAFVQEVFMCLAKLFNP